MSSESRKNFLVSLAQNPNALLGVLTLLYSLSTIGFFLFGIAAGQLNLFLANWLETSVRIVLALVSLAAVLGVIKGIRVWLLLVWHLLLTIFQFVIFPIEIFSGKNSSWNDLLKLGTSGQITGYESLNFSIGLSIIGSLFVIFFNEKTRANLIAGKLMGFLRLKVETQAEFFAKSNGFVKLSGLGVAVWASVNLIVYVMGISYGLVELDSKFLPALIEPLASLAILGIVVFSKWKRIRILSAVFMVVLWLFLLRPQLVSGQIGDYIFTLSTAIPDALRLISFVQNVSLWVIFISTVGIFLERMVNSYANRVKGWIDIRISEIYSDEVAGRGVEGPRTTSLLAVVSVFFAFTIPVIGLLFAHAARNEIAISRGTKLGTDLTVIAGVVSWLLIFVYALLILIFFVAQPLLGDPYWWLSLFSSFGI